MPQLFSHWWKIYRPTHTSLGWKQSGCWTRGKPPPLVSVPVLRSCPSSCHPSVLVIGAPRAKTKTEWLASNNRGASASSFQPLVAPRRPGVEMPRLAPALFCSPAGPRARPAWEEAAKWPQGAMMAATSGSHCCQPPVVGNETTGWSLPAQPSARPGMAGEQGRAGVFNGRRQKAPGFPTPALHNLPGSRPAILYNLLEETKAVVKYLHLILTFQKTKLILAWKDIPQSSIHHIYGSTLLPSLRYHILNLHQILLI